MRILFMFPILHRISSGVMCTLPVNLDSEQLKPTEWDELAEENTIPPFIFLHKYI